MKKALTIAAALAVIVQSPARAETMKMDIEGKGWEATTIVASQIPVGDQKVLSLSGKLEGSKISLFSLLLVPLVSDDPKGHYELKPTSVPLSSITQSLEGALTGSTAPKDVIGWLPQKGSGGGNFNVDLLGGDPLSDSFRIQSGTLDITGYDASGKSLSGTFSGVLISHDGSKKVTIQHGVLDAISIGP